MSDEIKQQTTYCIQESAYYSLQIDKFMDTTYHATLLVYVRNVGRGLARTISLQQRSTKVTLRQVMSLGGHL